MRFPMYPSLAWFRAVEAMSPSGHAPIDWSTVDIVTDRNALRKLLRWTRELKCDDFRIDTQVAGGRTVLFNHWAETLWRRTDKRFPGYGRSFEHESTRTAPGLGSLKVAEHYRIIQYVGIQTPYAMLMCPHRTQNFGELKMVVCFEVDAYVATTDDTLETSSSGPSNEETASNEDIRVICRGCRVPQDNIVEIKTNKKVKWRETYPQVFLAQTPHLFTACHEQGNFHQVQKHHIDDAYMRQVADDCQGDMAGLHDALLLVRDSLIRHRQQGRVSLLCQKGQLSLYRVENARSCLPDAVLQQFEVSIHASLA